MTEGGSDRTSRKRLPELGSLLFVCLLLTYVWGIGWSFYRHDAIAGGLSIVVPPYGLYRGIASTWEGPKWREGYDLNSEMIAALVAKAADGKVELDALRYKNRAREWLETLPVDEKFLLRRATTAYGAALVQFARNLLEDALSGLPPRPASDHSVAKHVAVLEQVPAFKRVWSAMLAETDLLQQNLLGSVGEISASKRESLLDSSSPMMLMLEARKRRIDLMISELFGN